MKRNKIARIIANSALLCTKVSVNSNCAFIYHQPEVPKGLKEMIQTDEKSKKLFNQFTC